MTSKLNKTGRNWASFFTLSALYSAMVAGSGVAESEFMIAMFSSVVSVFCFYTLSVIHKHPRFKEASSEPAFAYSAYDENMISFEDSEYADIVLAGSRN